MSTIHPTKGQKIWDNYEQIDEVQKTDSLKYVFGYASREGIRYLNIREFYKTKKTEEWKPGINGISIPLTTPTYQGPDLPLKLRFVLKEIIPVFEKALVELPTFDLYNPDNEVWKAPKVK